MNAKEVLTNVEARITEMEALPSWRRRYHLRIWDVCDELGIFDWWNEYLSLNQLKDMKKFLKEAIKLGYTGYACFKVGSTGCANGMWAYKKESTTGYSPGGDCLYKSFTPAYNYWSVNANDEWLPKVKYDSIKTIKELESFIKEVAE